MGTLTAQSDSACLAFDKAYPLADSLRYHDLVAARPLTEKLLLQARACKDPDRELRALGLLAYVAYLSGDYDAAAQYSEEQVSLCMAMEEPGRLGNLLNGLANFMSRFGQYDKAHAYLDQALPDCLAANDTTCWSTNLDNRGVILMRQGNFTAARESFEACYALRQQHGDTVGLGYVCENLGWEAMESGRSAEAISWVRRALFFRRQGGQADALATNINNLGEAHQAMGNCDSASFYYRDAVQRARRLGYQDLLRHALERLSVCAQESGDFPLAMDYLRQSFAIKDSLLNAEQVRAVARMEAEYDAALREQRIAIQDLEIEKKRAQNRNQLIIGSALLLLLVIGAFILWQRTKIKQQRRLQEERLAFQEDLLRHSIEVQESERKRIARDLHDGIGQRLSSLKLSWNRLSQRLRRLSPEQGEEMDRMNTILDQTAQEVRTLSHQMMPRALSAVGLAAALADLVDQQFRRSNVIVRFDHSGAEGRFDERIEIAMYRMAQEILGNISRHAAARSVDMQLHRTGKKLLLVVEDDGRGFDPKRVSTGHGLANLQSRATATGGDVRVESSPGNGTVVTVRLPLDPVVQRTGLPKSLLHA
jgi:signal transduction histidine kinase